MEERYPLLLVRAAQAGLTCAERIVHGTSPLLFHVFRKTKCVKIHRMINSQSPVRLKRTQILQIAARNGVERLRVFGSVARGTDNEQSDIDFLVELAPGRSLLDLGNFLYEVRSLLGKEVDVVTEQGLRHRIRDRVLAEAVDL